MAVETGTLVVRGLDGVDGTPLLDIKPERLAASGSEADGGRRRCSPGGVRGASRPAAHVTLNTPIATTVTKRAACAQCGGPA